MINIKDLEKDFENVAKKLEKKGFDKDKLKYIQEQFKLKKQEQQKLEEQKANLNKYSKEFGQKKRNGEDTTELKKDIDIAKAMISQIGIALEPIEKNIKEELLIIPNIPDENVPEGKDEKENIVIEKVLRPRTFKFVPKKHWELKNWIDFQRGVKLAGSRFAVLRNDGAKIERALINFFLDENEKAGFAEVSVPYLNNSEMLKGTGQLPKFEDDLYKIEGEDLYLIPTGEVPLTNMFNDEILEKDELPILLTSHTPCFRKEAGSAGKDTRGIIRQHQFHKVELVAITKPEESDEIFEKMVNHVSNLLTKLELPHRIVQLCGGDLGFSAAKTIDLEVWLPGQSEYREISSLSNTRDFQARRAKIRYKDGKKNELVHTLNGSAIAVGRTIVAIMENYQNEDGTIEIPEVLRKYM